MGKQLLIIVIYFLCHICDIEAQVRPFEQWGKVAFCQYSQYHPFNIIRWDNNWELLLALRTPQTMAELKSKGINCTSSQLTLLQIEGLISCNDSQYKTEMPVLDSLQTTKLRAYSEEMAKHIYIQTKSDFQELVTYLKKVELQDNAFSIVFSYILDGKIWKQFIAPEKMKPYATWSGCCWALFKNRSMQCGTNTYDNYCMTWIDKQPQFLWDIPLQEAFYKPFIKDAVEYKKIKNDSILKLAVGFGFAKPDGSIRVPLIPQNDSSFPINVCADSIVGKITDYFASSSKIVSLQQEYGIEDFVIFRTILYHEVMWNIVDCLLNDKVISLPNVWKNQREEESYQIFYVVHD